MNKQLQRHNAVRLQGRYGIPLLSLFLFMGLARAEVALPTRAQLDEAYQVSIKHLLNNLKHPGISPGAVIASPSTSSPNYFFHWTRDAALTHESLYQLFESTQDSELKQQIRSFANSWIDFETKAQINSMGKTAGLGEPRFFVNGFVNEAEWGRPQSDGPASRAITMMLWAQKILTEENGEDFVKTKLYRVEWPATSLIKMDLEYVAHNWRAPSFDLWEEVRGLHFYTLAMQRKALMMGAKLADRLQDLAAATFYLIEARNIEAQMNRFLEAGKPYVVVTLDHPDWTGNKHSGLDIAIAIAVNHVLYDDPFFTSHKDLFTNTLVELEKRFREIYPINHIDSHAPGIGRYPEDIYDGVAFSGAHPWFLATHASAEYYCKISKLEASSERALELKNKGLSFMARTLRHRNQETGEMSEQFSRYTGHLAGASHLTWSYASYITAYQACE